MKRTSSILLVLMLCLGVRAQDRILVSTTNGDTHLSGIVVTSNTIPASAISGLTSNASVSASSLLSTNLSRFDIATSDNTKWVLVGTLDTTKSGCVHVVGRAMFSQANGYGGLGIGVGPVASTSIVSAVNKDISNGSYVPGTVVTYSGVVSSNTVISLWATSSTTCILTNGTAGSNAGATSNALGLTVLQLP